MKNKFLLFTISLLTALVFITGCNEKNVTVTFDTNGGSNIAKEIIEKDSKVSKPNDPTKDNYIFVEWTYDNESYDFDTKVTKDITLVAKYRESGSHKKSFTVKFDTDGGNTIKDQIVKVNQKATLPTVPEKSGYTFSKWTVNGQDFDFNSTITKDIIVKAVWKKSDSTVINPTPGQPVSKKYTVAFNTNGGSAIYNKIVNEGQAVGQPGNPTKVGFNFAGWTLNGNAYNFANRVYTNITLVANWTAVVVADKYTYRLEELMGSTPSWKVFVYKNGIDVTKDVKAVYTASGLFLGKYEDEYKAISVDKNDKDKIAGVKVDGKLIKF
ncbi:MAG: InlB B-repeat-containing protein [Bacilli bacterium]